MIVELPSGKYRIYFRHTNNGSGCWNYSECHIRDTHGELVAYGQAKCCPEDQFSFAKGRKIALDRALFTGIEGISFSRPERTQIWQQYYKEHRDLDRKARVPKIMKESI